METRHQGRTQELEYLDVKDTNGSSIQKLYGKNEKPIQVSHDEWHLDKTNDWPVLQIISAGEHLALDLVRSMDNLKKAIMTTFVYLIS